MRHVHQRKRHEGSGQQDFATDDSLVSDSALYVVPDRTVVERHVPDDKNRKQEAKDIVGRHPSVSGRCQPGEPAHVIGDPSHGQP